MLWLCCTERFPPAPLGYESPHNMSSLPQDPGWSPISTWQKSQWAMPSTTTWVPQPPDQYFHPRNPLFLTINMIYFSWLCLVWFKIQYFFSWGTIWSSLYYCLYPDFWKAKSQSNTFNITFPNPKWQAHLKEFPERNNTVQFQNIYLNIFRLLNEEMTSCVWAVRSFNFMRWSGMCRSGWCHRPIHSDTKFCYWKHKHLVTKNNVFGMKRCCFVKHFNLQGVSQRLNLVTCHKFHTDFW